MCLAEIRELFSKEIISITEAEAEINKALIDIDYTKDGKITVGELVRALLLALRKVKRK